MTHAISVGALLLFIIIRTLVIIAVMPLYPVRHVMGSIMNKLDKQKRAESFPAWMTYYTLVPFYMVISILVQLVIDPIIHD